MGLLSAMTVITKTKTLEQTATVLSAISDGDVLFCVQS